jgi:hypothetical protein
MGRVLHPFPALTWESPPPACPGAEQSSENLDVVRCPRRQLFSVSPSAHPQLGPYPWASFAILVLPQPPSRGNWRWWGCWGLCSAGAIFP